MSSPACRSGRLVRKARRKPRPWSSAAAPPDASGQDRSLIGFEIAAGSQPGAAQRGARRGRARAALDDPAPRAGRRGRARPGRDRWASSPMPIRASPRSPPSGRRSCSAPMRCRSKEPRHDREAAPRDPADRPLRAGPRHRCGRQPRLQALLQRRRVRPAARGEAGRAAQRGGAVPLSRRRRGGAAARDRRANSGSTPTASCAARGRTISSTSSASPMPGRAPRS